jgi:hypothetical protein
MLGEGGHDDGLVDAVVVVILGETEDVGRGAVALGEVEGDGTEFAIGGESTVEVDEHVFALVDCCINNVPGKVLDDDVAVAVPEVGDGFCNVLMNYFLLALVGGEGDEVEGKGAGYEVEVAAGFLGDGVEGMVDENFPKVVANWVVGDNDTDKAGISTTLFGPFGIGRIPSFGGNDRGETDGFGLGK